MLKFYHKRLYLPEFWFLFSRSLFTFIFVQSRSEANRKWRAEAIVRMTFMVELLKMAAWLANKRGFNLLTSVQRQSAKPFRLVLKRAMVNCTIHLLLVVCVIDAASLQFNVLFQNRLSLGSRPSFCPVKWEKIRERDGISSSRGGSRLIISVLWETILVNAKSSLLRAIKDGILWKT